jgi:membrane protein YqaA with SNARE-associated domain
MKAIYQWLGKHVHAPYGTCIFGLLVFIEGFFIVPVSTLVAFFSLSNRPKALMYAGIATLVSGLGALAGYGVGMLLWKAGGRAFLDYIIDAHKFDQLVEQFKAYQAWTTFVVALTPMPYKILTFSAGFMRLPVLPFILLSMCARGLRFFGISAAIYIWGEKVQYYLDTYFYWVIAVGTAFFIALWIALH